jgi:hypothetical protein
MVFKEDQARLRKGHGAKNMAIVRPFAVNLVRVAKDKSSIKLRRKPLAGTKPISPNYSARRSVSPDSEPCRLQAAVRQMVCQ